MPVLVLFVLWNLRPKEIDIRTYILVWFLASPIGFLLWVFGWFTYGAGEGRISAAVGATAIIGWCALHRGLYLAWIKQQRLDGCAIFVIALVYMVVIRAISGNGTAPITLAAIAALVGAALPLAVLVLTTVNSTTRRMLSVAWPPIWKFLSQPVTLPGWRSHVRS